MQTATRTFEGCLPPMAVAGAPESSSEENLERLMQFEGLLSRNLPRLRRMAMRWLRNPEDAEDAVQDALLSAFKHIARFEGRSQMSTWLIAIVMNAVRMELRRRPRKKILSLDEPSKDDRSAISDLIADSQPSPEQTLEQREMRALVTKLARTLPAAQRKALQLREWDGLSTSEAAEALGVPQGTLKAQLARGRAKLTRRLADALGMSRTGRFHRGSVAKSGGREITSGASPEPAFTFKQHGGGATWMGE
jgi:RNA polymerase sigma-70 factor, ECF subfamily